MAAQGQRAALNDPDLGTVIDAWDRLPEAARSVGRPEITPAPA
jgi:hypothetical protein